MLAIWLRLHFKRVNLAELRKNKKENKGSQKKGSPKKGKRGCLWQRLTSLEMQPGAKLRRISRGLYFAAPRLRFRTRSNAGRTSVRSLGRI